MKTRVSFKYFVTGCKLLTFGMFSTAVWAVVVAKLMALGILSLIPLIFVSVLFNLFCSKVH